MLLTVKVIKYFLQSRQLNYLYGFNPLLQSFLESLELHKVKFHVSAVRSSLTLGAFVSTNNSGFNFRKSL